MTRKNKKCEHGKRKSYYCKSCGGSAFCEHGKRKSRCIPCGGSQICEHGKRKSICIPCGGSQICEHGKLKSYCKSCGGSSLCKSSWCETKGITKYNGYCLPCCIQICPEIKVSRNYKTKEKDVVDRIKEIFPDFTWVSDKRIKDGCSLRRPDLLLDIGSHVIIIEIDENKHSGYSCENKRLMQLSKDLNHRPIIFIRFNPDSYKDNDGKTISSCWGLNKVGVMTIKKPKEKEWNMRILTLKNQIQYCISNESKKMIEIIELFY